VLRALRPLEHALLPQAVRLLAGGALGADPENPRHIAIRTGEVSPAGEAMHADEA
jgi:hypothetical protein